MTVDPDGVRALVTVILRGTPSLPACIGHHELFDEVPGSLNRDQRRERYEAAVTLCSRCPYRRGVRVAGLIGPFCDSGKHRYQIRISPAETS